MPEPAMTAMTLLAELAALPDPGRMRRMVEIGQRAPADPNIAAAIRTLAGGNRWDRRLALQSCYGSHDGAHVVRALGDPSRSLRGLAVALVPVACDPAEAEAALDNVQRHQRRDLLAALVRSRRHTEFQPAIDRYIERLAANRDEQLARLLRFASADVVARHLNHALERAGADDWRGLTRAHPELVADALDRRIAATATLDARLTWIVNLTLPDLATRLPNRALSIVGALRPHVPLAQLDLQLLAQRRPNEVASLLLESEATSRIRFDRLARKLNPQRLLELLIGHPETLPDIPGWLERLPPRQRGELFAVAGRGWRDGSGVLDPRIVALLPHAEREQEARRHLALPALATRPSDQLAYAAFLPWEAARTFLDTFIRNPDPELRGTALAALVRATRFNRDRAGEMLALLHARRNEQDPVRQAALTALEELPAGIWQAERLDSLGQVIRDALDAADLSAHSLSSIGPLLLSLVPAHPGWAAGWLATLARERGAIATGRYYLSGADSRPLYEQRLSDAEVRQIAPILLPVLQAWSTRELDGQLIIIAQALGKRLPAFDGLLDLLERVIARTVNGWNADSALELIATHDPLRLQRLVPSLLDADPSWITRPPIHNWLHRYRQNLLDPYLGQRAYTGRFASGKTRYVLPLTHGFDRWRPSQQATFATTLTELLDDTAQSHWVRMSAIDRLAALPDIAPDTLIRYAAPGDPARAVVRDVALRALARLDAGQGIPTLLDALNDDRARIAIYALRRSILELPPSQALTLLATIPLERLTVAKEVIRLTGEIPTPDAYARLLALDGGELQRDLRVALLRALWNWVEHDETWPILERAAAADDPALAAGVVNIPVERLSPAAEARVAMLLAHLLRHPEPRIRINVLKRLVSLPLTDRERRMLPGLFDALDSQLPDEFAAAAGALFATYAGRDAALIGIAITRILPNRRALLTTITTLQSELRWKHEQLLPAAQATIDALAVDPLASTLRLTLAAHALTLPNLTAILETAASNGSLHPEALLRVVQTLESARFGRHTAMQASQPANHLTTSPDDRLRRIALAILLGSARDFLGWTDDRLAQLAGFRADPSPLVATAAQFTFPPE